MKEVSLTFSPVYMTLNSGVFLTLSDNRSYFDMQKTAFPNIPGIFSYVSRICMRLIRQIVELPSC